MLWFFVISIAVLVFGIANEEKLIRFEEKILRGVFSDGKRKIDGESR